MSNNYNKLDTNSYSFIDDPLEITKNAQLNWIFDNPMFANLLKGALKGLKYVAISTFDYKLSLITTGLESWIKRKEKEWEEEQEKKKREREELGLY